MTWPRLLMCWIPEGWEGPFGPNGGIEVVYVDRAHGLALFLMPDVPF